MKRLAGLAVIAGNGHDQGVVEKEYTLTAKGEKALAEVLKFYRGLAGPKDEK